MEPNQYHLAVSTMSLGRAWLHDLVPKLEEASRWGFQGIELFYEDLEYHASEHFGGKTSSGLAQAASNIKELCVKLNLEIVCLQPLMHYEGLRNASTREAARERAELYFTLANILETSIVAVPSSFLSTSEITDDTDVIVKDLQDLADLANSYHLRLVYEALSWGTYVDHWEQSWSIVQAVNRKNFGICLDTFNIAARIYADPASPSGMTNNAVTAVEESLRNMVLTMDASKIFYIQVVDAERLAAPLDENHEFYDASQSPRMSWSRNCRLFYGETARGAYLPVRQIMETIVHDVGFRGWVSMELFNRSMADPSPMTPSQHAERGAIAWAKLQQDLRLNAAELHQSADVATEVTKPRALL